MHSMRCQRHVSLSLCAHSYTHTYLRTWASHKPVQDISRDSRDSACLQLLMHLKVKFAFKMWHMFAICLWWPDHLRVTFATEGIFWRTRSIQTVCVYLPNSGHNEYINTHVARLCLFACFALFVFAIDKCLFCFCYRCHKAAGSLPCCGIFPLKSDNTNLVYCFPV